MAEVPFSHSVIPPRPVDLGAGVRPPAPPSLGWSPTLTDGLVVIGGAVLFALAGGLLGGYMMLPFEIG